MCRCRVELLSSHKKAQSDEAKSTFTRLKNNFYSCRFLCLLCLFVAIHSRSFEIGSGRAVSRFLSAPLRVERIICLSSRYPKPVCFRRHGTSRSSVSYLALHPMGFSVPRRLRFARWSLTPPFHPYQHRLRNAGGIFSVALSVGTTHAVASRVYLRLNRSYAASRPMVFGLSSPDLRQKRFSALPEPITR